MKKISIAVIGAGTNTQRSHLPVLKRLSDEGLLDLITICDLNLSSAKNLAKTFGFSKASHDAEATIRDPSIEAVYIFGTVKMHYDLAKMALNAGKHVFVEKPPTFDFIKTQELSDLAKSKGLIATTGFNRRYYLSIKDFKEELDRGAKITSIESVYNKPFFNESYIYESSSWVTYSAIHGIDATLAIMSHKRPKYLFSSVNIASGELPQNVSALFIWDSGEQAVLSSNNSAGSRIEKYSIHIHGKTYECDERQITTITESSTDQHIYEDLQKSRGFYDEHRAFIDSVQSGSVEINNMSNCIDIMYIAHLIESSFRGEIDWANISNTTSNNLSNPVSSEVHSNKGRSSVLILDSATLRNQLPRISAKYKLQYIDDLPSLSKEELGEIVAVVTGPNGSPLDKDILKNLNNLKVAGIIGASLKKYNPQVAIDLSIPIVNASDQYAKAVAEFTLMQALVGIKHASEAHDAMRYGIWNFTEKQSLVKSLKSLNKKVAFIKPFTSKIWQIIKPNLKTQKSVASNSNARGGVNLSGCTVGLIGYGAIARNFIRLLKPFDCKIKIFSEHLTDQEAETLGVSKASMNEILSCDIISMHRGLSDRTRNSFGRKEIFGIKPGAVFINNARAEIVDESALLERLKKGDIFACLDVFHNEPLTKNNPYKKFKNVFLTSHIGGATKQTFGNSAESVIDQIFDFLDGKEVPNMITTSQMLDNMT